MNLLGILYYSLQIGSAHLPIHVMQYIIERMCTQVMIRIRTNQGFKSADVIMIGVMCNMSDI